MQVERKKANKKRLMELVKSNNIADELSDEDLNKYAGWVVNGYEIDENHPIREEKKTKWEEGGKIVRQVIEEKTNLAGDKVSNAKMPITAIAAIQFNARAYPSIVDGNRVVKPQMWGDISPDEPQNEQEAAQQEQEKQVFNQKLKRAERACDFQNWQLFNQFETWEEDTDNLTLLVSLYGEMYREVYYSAGTKKLRTATCTPETLVYDPMASTLDEAPRRTKLFDLYPYQIETKIRNGTYKDFEYQQDEESQEPQRFLRQDCRLDLDEDGYPEPYFVTVHQKEQKIVRIEANYTLGDIESNDEGFITEIPPIKTYVKYGFLPPMNGGGMCTGFFDVLYPVNEEINAIVNMINDAGAFANSQTGFIDKRLRLKRGNLKVNRGTLKPVNNLGRAIREGIYMLDFKEPSMALFQLLGFMTEFAKEVSGTKDVLTGQHSVNASPTTMVAMIEQGLKVFSGIYKRLHRAMKEEQILIREWNYKLIDAGQYQKVVDAKGVSKEDFSGAEFDFIPVTDVSVVTDMQKAALAQFYMQFLNDPYLDQVGLRRDVFELAGAHKLVEHIQDIDPSEQAQMMQLQLRMMQERRMMREAENTALELSLDQYKAESDRMGKRAGAVKDMATARKELAEIVNDRLRTGADIEKIIGEVRSIASASPAAQQVQ